jgi:hypothetical protein
MILGGGAWKIVKVKGGMYQKSFGTLALNLTI